MEERKCSFKKTPKKKNENELFINEYTAKYNN